MPSDERSSFEDRKKSTMDANRLRASYFNTGHAGRRNSSSLDELIYEFPRNTNREYMYFMSVHFGTEVQAQNSSDVLQIVNVASYKTNRDGSQNWSLNPIEGYSRDDSKEIARSDRGPSSPLGNTWPNTWPDKFEDGDQSRVGRFGAFLTTAIAFFLVEIGDKTQIATIALGAQFDNLLAVTAGTTLGMMIANVPAVLFGEALARKVDERARAATSRFEEMKSKEDAD